MSNGKDDISTYDFSMIFNNINKVSEIKDENNVDNSEDNLYNTNLISELDLQNFDPKRYEYYTNLVYIYRKDKKTLYDLLRKYYSIKNLKGKEKKLIRTISNYARLHREANYKTQPIVQSQGTKTDKVPSKDLLRIVGIVLRDFEIADDFEDMSFEDKVCILIIYIIKKFVNLETVKLDDDDDTVSKFFEHVLKISKNLDRDVSGMQQQEGGTRGRTRVRTRVSIGRTLRGDGENDETIGRIGSALLGYAQNDEGRKGLEKGSDHSQLEVSDITPSTSRSSSDSISHIDDVSQTNLEKLKEKLNELTTTTASLKKYNSSLNEDNYKIIILIEKLGLAIFKKYGGGYEIKNLNELLPILNMMKNNLPSSSEDGEETASNLKILLDIIEFMIKYKEYNAPMTGGTNPKKVGEGNEVITLPDAKSTFDNTESGLEKLMKGIEEMQGNNDPIIVEDETITTKPNVLVSGRRKPPSQDNDEKIENKFMKELSSLMERINILEATVHQNTHGNGKNLVGKDLAKDSLVVSGIKSAINFEQDATNTYNKIKEGINNKVGELNKSIKRKEDKKKILINEINEMMKDPLISTNKKHIEEIIKNIILKNAKEINYNLKELYKLNTILFRENNDGKTLLKKINKKLVLLYEDETRLSLIKYTVNILYNELYNIIQNISKENIDACNTTDIVNGSVVNINNDIQLYNTNNETFKVISKNDETNMYRVQSYQDDRIFYLNKKNAVCMSQEKARLNKNINIEFSKNIEGIVFSDYVNKEEILVKYSENSVVSLKFEDLNLKQIKLGSIFKVINNFHNELYDEGKISRKIGNDIDNYYVQIKGGIDYMVNKSDIIYKKDMKVKVINGNYKDYIATIFSVQKNLILVEVKDHKNNNKIAQHGLKYNEIALEQGTDVQIIKKTIIDSNDEEYEVINHYYSIDIIKLRNTNTQNIINVNMGHITQNMKIIKLLRGSVVQLKKDFVKVYNANTDYSITVKKVNNTVDVCTDMDVLYSVEITGINIEVEGNKNITLNGIYNITSEVCNNFPVYKHINDKYVMWYSNINGIYGWCIGKNNDKCTEDMLAYIINNPGNIAQDEKGTKIWSVYSYKSNLWEEKNGINVINISNKQPLTVSINRENFIVEQSYLEYDTKVNDDVKIIGKYILNGTKNKNMNVISIYDISLKQKIEKITLKDLNSANNKYVIKVEYITENEKKNIVNMLYCIDAFKLETTTFDIISKNLKNKKDLFQHINVNNIKEEIKAFIDLLIIDFNTLYKLILTRIKCIEKRKTYLEKNLLIVSSKEKADCTNRISFLTEEGVTKCNNLIYKLKSYVNKNDENYDLDYLDDIILSLNPNRNKLLVVKKIIHHLLNDSLKIKADANKVKFLNEQKVLIDKLKLIQQEQENINNIIFFFKKHKEENKKEEPYIYYIDIIINKLTALFTCDNADIDLSIPNKYIGTNVRVYDKGSVLSIDIKNIISFITKKDPEAIDTKLNFGIILCEIPKDDVSAEQNYVNFIDIVKDDAQGGGAPPIDDDVLKAQYLNNDLNDNDENKIIDILKKLKEQKAESKNGKIKTKNKIEQLSNDIDVYYKNDPPSINDTKRMIQQINNFENDPNNPIEELALTFDDRLVFIIATFFIRYITIMLVQWCIDINIIKTFYEGFIYYAVIYIIIFWFIVLFINVDNSYDVNYMNFNGIINSIRTLFYYFYMGTNGISRLLIHTSLIIILIIVPILLNIKNKVEYVDEEESENTKLLNNDERKQLSRALSLFTMFIWLFTSIIATKF
jgi:hypothetical protein